ncbi:MAG TPA: alpha/beta hydrolase [Polyangia bacterium]|jgi:pimeloyl-ACP methyl ester carboxylesterase|nr:alpha/beta hydrolase [Polyangia bacterium]
MKRIGRWLARIGLGIVALGIVGALYEGIAGWRDARRYQPRGTLVDIGGRRLHLYCIGEGSPTVLLQSGYTDWSLGWSTVQPEIAKFARVCSYDRPGLGDSDPSPDAGSTARLVEDLHTLLDKAHVPPPYVLVGHSAGGMYQRLFAAAHPETVAGMVLVDTDERSARGPATPRPPRATRSSSRSPISACRASSSRAWGSSSSSRGTTSSPPRSRGATWPVSPVAPAPRRASVYSTVTPRSG